MTIIVCLPPDDGTGAWSRELVTGIDGVDRYRGFLAELFEPHAKSKATTPPSGPVDEDIVRRVRERITAHMAGS